MKLNKSTIIPNFFIFLILFTNIVSVSILTVFINIPSSIIQLVIYGSYLMILFLYIKNTKINIWLFLLVLFAFISLIVNEYDPKFNAPLRLFLWILVLSTLGPLLFSSTLIKVRTKLLKAFLKTFYITGAISTLFWVFNLPVLGLGSFTGLFIQSMILAPVASIGALYVFQLFIDEKKRNLKNLYLILFLLNTMSVILAASRGALIAFTIGFIILITFINFKFKRIILISLIATLSIIFYFNEPTTLLNKNNNLLNNLYDKGLKNSRDQLWDARINEFYSSPIFGIGFATQTANYEFQKIDEQGRIEPGSTYLMILAMTGSFGFIAFLIFMFKALSNKYFFYRITKTDVSYSAILGFFLVHFLIEGYIFSSGSLMGLVFWLLLGVTYPYSNNEMQKENII